MDPRSVSISGVSETPDDFNGEECGGDTLKRGFLFDGRDGKSADSELIDSGYIDGMDGAVNKQSEESTCLSTQQSPKFEGSTRSNIKVDESPGVDPTGLDACSTTEGGGNVHPGFTESREGSDGVWSCRDTDLPGKSTSDIDGKVSEHSLPGEAPVCCESSLSLTDDGERTEILKQDSLADDATDALSKQCNGLDDKSDLPTGAAAERESSEDLTKSKQGAGDFVRENDGIKAPDSQSSATGQVDTEAEIDVTFNFSSDEDDMTETQNEVTCWELSKDTSVYHNEKRCIQTMANLKDMRKRELYCDVVITVNDNCYKAHKCILAANSNVLQAIINSSEKDIIDLSESVNSSEAFESILEYLYTGQISVSMATVGSILASCKKLGVSNVSQTCFLHVEKNITISNWAHILDLSMNYDFPEVAQKVVRFFSENIRQLYKTKEAMYFSVTQLEQILRRLNHRRANDIELYKLDLIIHWVITDYENRSAKLQYLLQYINIGLLTKEAMELLFRQKTVKCHDIFQDQTIKMFISDVRESLVARKKAQQLARKSRQSSHSIKVSKRGRPRKIVDYNQVDDSSVDDPDRDEDEYIPGLPLEPVVLLKKKRGRPPKSKDGQVGSVKRARGRPKKSTPQVRPVQQQIIKQENEESRTDDLDEPLVTKEVVVKTECVSKPDPAVKVPSSKVKKKSWIRSVPNPDGHVCLTCGKKFALRKQLTRHGIIHKEKTKMCDLCDYKTTRNDKVRDHIRRVHADEAVQRGLLSAEERKRRMLMEANKSRIHRPRKSRMKRLLETGPDEMISCPKCPRKFTSMSSLRHHMKGHGSDTPFLCEICGFTTKHFASINVHKRQHNGKKFRCTFPGCTYENIRKSRLDDHISAHTGIKNHVCSVCGKAFAGRKHMQRHEKTHLEVKPLKCEECDYATTRGDKLRDHIRKHHRIVAVNMGILDPEKADELKVLKPARMRKPKKKIKCDKEQEASLLISDTVQQLIDGDPNSSVTVSRQETDQVTNYVAMAVPSHLLGVTSSALNEDVIQYLASMTPGNNLTGTHSQIHPSLTVPAQTLHNSQTVQGVSISQASAVAVHAVQPQQQLVRTQPSQQVSTDRDTWIYHIIPDGQHQFS